MGSSGTECESESRSDMSNCLWTHGVDSSWNSPDQDTGVGSLSLLQGISPTQGSNPGLPHCRQILYPLSHKGKGKKKKNIFLNNPGSKSEINTKATKFLPEVMEHAKVLYRVKCIYFNGKIVALEVTRSSFKNCAINTHQLWNFAQDPWFLGLPLWLSW